MRLVVHDVTAYRLFSGWLLNGDHGVVEVIMPDGATLVSLLAVLVTAALLAFVFLRRRSARSVRDLAATIAARNVGEDTTGTLRDISREHRGVLEAFDRATAVLRERVARAERERQAVVSVLSRLGDGVLVTDSRGVIVLANRIQLERLRLPEHRVVGRSLIEVTQDHEVHEVVQRCLVSGMEQRSLVEIEPGRRFVNVIANSLGQGSGCVVVFQDRTELRRLEKVRRDFVANISHELRTPLATLKLLSETVSLGGADDPALLRDYLGRIEVEVDRLAQMVDELGELSLIESGRIALEKLPVPVPALIVRAVERLEAQAVRAGLRLEVASGEDLPEPLGDERWLEQVLVNLLHNAIKFTPEGGTVRVAAGEADGALVVSVEDSGIGIPADDLDRIFERFYKTDKSRSSTGTGLGLAIARHIIEIHGGRIWAESVEGRGSRFAFTLPLGDVPEQL